MRFVRPFALSLALGATAFAAETQTMPVHGVVLRVIDRSHATVRLDAVEQMRVERSDAFRIAPEQSLAPGTQIDALLQGDNLLDVARSAGYTAGIPDERSFTTLGRGDELPHAHLVDQDGRLVDLATEWRGKTLLVTFVFTRCPDAQICPAISGKFAYLQDHLDAGKTHLLEITLDPKYDSPKVLSAYAQRYGAISERWTIASGEQNQIGLLINRFGLSSLENRPGNFEHDDTLAIVDPSGKISEIIPTAGWAPDDVVATVLNQQGAESNPLRRLELAAIAGVVSVCGGSTTTGQVVLDSLVFVAGVLFFGGLLYLFGRRIWKTEK